MSFIDTIKERVASAKARLAITAVSLVGLVQYASAGTLNTSIAPIITDMVELFTPLLNLIIAAVPLIIAVGLISFILGILTGILSHIKM